MPSNGCESGATLGRAGGLGPVGAFTTLLGAAGLDDTPDLAAGTGALDDAAAADGAADRPLAPALAAVGVGKEDATPAAPLLRPYRLLVRTSWITVGLGQMVC